MSEQTAFPQTTALQHGTRQKLDSAASLMLASANSRSKLVQLLLLVPRG